jgi:hypothetical protein
MRDLTFLLETRVFSTREIESLAKEVLFVLRNNRRRATLPLDQVEVGNSFILAAHRLSCADPSLDLLIPAEDVAYILEETELLNMGSARN